MPRFRIFKELLLEVTVEAPTAQEAYDQMLDMDDNQFTVLECDYDVRDEAGEDANDQVRMT